jgi:hypothetical protein
MRRILLVGLVLAVVGVVFVGPAFAQRRIIGSDEEGAADAGPPPVVDAGPAKKGDKKDDKKGDKKAPDAGPAGSVKPDDKKPKDNKDVLEETSAEKKKADEAEAKKKAAEAAAEKAAEEAKKKAEEEKKKLLEEKKAADDKKKLENKDARLAAAKKIRQITRKDGSIGVSFAIEPGEVKANALTEVRVNVTKKLEQADPRYGNLEPQKNQNIVVTVQEPGAKKGGARYALHALEAPGRYGFHFTPTKKGAYTLAVNGKDAEGHTWDATMTLHVDTWPPPDFDDEEKNNIAAGDDAARAGRKVMGGN